MQQPGIEGGPRRAAYHLVRVKVRALRKPELWSLSSVTGLIRRWLHAWYAGAYWETQAARGLRTDRRQLWRWLVGRDAFPSWRVEAMLERLPKRLAEIERQRAEDHALIDERYDARVQELRSLVPLMAKWVEENRRPARRTRAIRKPRVREAPADKLIKQD